MIKGWYKNSQKKKKLTIVLNNNAKTRLNFKKRTKQVTREGLSAGCLNINAGFGLSQYSSSHSTGKLTSKLVVLD